MLKSISIQGESLFPRMAGNPFWKSSVFRKTLLLCLAVLAVNVVYAQKALKITRMRQVTWDTYNKVWSPWPTDWRTYESGNEPVLTLYRLDNDGYKFRVNMIIKGQNYTFDVAYSGYDDNNKWYKYKDENGDEIAVIGSTISKLSSYGWPDSVVQIYFWIYSQNLGIELE